MKTQNSKTQIVTIIKKNKWWQDSKIKFWQNLKTQIVKKLKKSNCGKTQKIKFCFFSCVLPFLFFLESFSTHLTEQCFKCLLHMNKHIWGYRCHICGRKFKKKWLVIKHLQKQHKHYFGSQSKISRFQTSFTKS